MTELTAAECATRINDLIKMASNYFEFTGKPVASLSFTREMLEPLQQAAAVMRKLANGELREVVHARWEYGQGAWPHCSNCGHDALLNGVEEEELSPYCPNCATLMDLTGSNSTPLEEDNNATD